MKKTQKLVEVGVAIGETTAAMIEHLCMSDYSCKMYSVDKSKKYYRDKTKKQDIML